MSNKNIIKCCALVAVWLTMLFYFFTSCKTTTYNLDNDPEVLDWYIDNNDTIIYRKEDSVRDSRERWEYHRSLAHDSLWE